jgi:hypothetical protein
MEEDVNYQYYKKYCLVLYSGCFLKNKLKQLLDENRELNIRKSRL